MEKSAKEYLFKVLLVGDSSVGKSSILNYYLKGEFISDYNATVSVEYGTKAIDLDSKHNVKLQIWDTAGQKSFRSIVKSFYRNSSAVFLLYNVTDRDTFINLDVWLTEIKENSNENIVIVLIGNKIDQVSERKVSYQEGENFAKNKKIELFYETSACTGENIEKCFRKAARRIYTNHLAEISSKPADGQLYNPSINLAENRGYSVLDSKLLSASRATNDANNEKKGGCC